MALESLFTRDRKREREVLAYAKEKNSEKTVPIKVYGGIVLVTPQQAADKEYMARIKENYAPR